MARLVRRGMRANAALNLATRLMLGVFGLTAGAFAIRYVDRHGEEMVDMLHRPRPGGDVLAKQFLALSAPVLLFAVFAGLAAALAWMTHSRGQEEMCRTLDLLSRLKREGEVAVSARGLMFAFEEKLNNARRAFTLLLWLGRTLFIICLGLFVAAVTNAMLSGAPVLTVAFGTSSLAGSLLAVSRGVPRAVRGHLAEVVQIQSIITGCDRQISLLESDALDALNRGDRDGDEPHRVVVDVQERMNRVVIDAVELIERVAGRDSREAGG